MTVKRKFRSQMLLLLICAITFAPNRGNSKVRIGTSIGGPFNNFAMVESVGYEVACGKTTAGLTECTGSHAAFVQTSVSFGAVKSTYFNEDYWCAEDEDGFACRSAPHDRAYLVNGMTPRKAIDTLVTESVPGSIKLSKRSACGLSSMSGDLVCHFPEFRATSSHYLRLAVSKGLKTYSLNDEMVCLADGDEIFCRNDDDTIKNTIYFPGIKDFAVTNWFVCARTESEAKCWDVYNFTESTLPAEFLTARQWREGTNAICAITSDNRIICVDPGTMLPPRWGTGTNTPAEFKVSNGTDLVDYWITSGAECALRSDRNIWCWDDWMTTMINVGFSGPVDRPLTESRRYAPCAILVDGRMECAWADSSPFTFLRKPDRVRIIFSSGSNAIQWNSSAVEFVSQKPNLTNLTAVSSAPFGEPFCAVGTETSDSTQSLVQCTSSISTLREPPKPLYQPKLVAAAEYRVCAASDTVLSCWGSPWTGTRPPINIRYPKKLQLSQSHGCTLDNYGLICWGDLANFGLKIPAGLETPGRVVDFAIVAGGTCAILDDGTLQCWGDGVLPKEVPTATNATSIASSFEGGFCMNDGTGLHCWGKHTSSLPK